MSRVRTSGHDVRRPIALAVTAVAIMAAAVTGMTHYASASLINVQPRALSVSVVADRPDVPGVLRLVASEDTWNDDRARSARHGDDPRLAVADSSQGCLVIADSSCTDVRNARTYVKFDLSAVPASATIESATIQMVGGPTSISSAPVAARRVTESWSESSMTYNSRPRTTRTGSVTGASVASDGLELLTFDVTELVTDRDRVDIANGWELRPNGNNDSWWYSSEWDAPELQPTLTVVYR